MTEEQPPPPSERSTPPTPLQPHRTATPPPTPPRTHHEGDAGAAHPNVQGEEKERDKHVETERDKHLDTHWTVDERFRQTRNADELRTKSRGSHPREDKEDEDEAAATKRGQGRTQPPHARWSEQGEVNECSAGSLEECSTLNSKLNAKLNALGEEGQGAASVGLEEEGDEQFGDDSGGIEEEVSEEVGSLSWRLQALEKELDLEDDVAAHEAV